MDTKTSQPGTPPTLGETISQQTNNGSSKPLDVVIDLETLQVSPRQAGVLAADLGRPGGNLGFNGGTAIEMGVRHDAQAAYNNALRRQVMDMMNSTINPAAVIVPGSGVADTSIFDRMVTSGAIFPGGSSQTPRPAPEPRRAAPQVTVRVTQAANGQIIDLASTGGRTITWLVPDGEPLGANIDAALAVLKLEGQA